MKKIAIFFALTLSAATLQTNAEVCPVKDQAKAYTYRKAGVYGGDLPAPFNISWGPRNFERSIYLTKDKIIWCDKNVLKGFYYYFQLLNIDIYKNEKKLKVVASIGVNNKIKGYDSRGRDNAKKPFSLYKKCLSQDCTQEVEEIKSFRQEFLKAKKISQAKPKVASESTQWESID